jgi:hypothetical protein
MQNDPLDDLKLVIEGGGPTDARHARRLSLLATAHIRNRRKAADLHESLAAALTLIPYSDRRGYGEGEAGRRRARQIVEMIAGA